MGLYEVVRFFVAEVIVCDPRHNKLLSEGSKGDKIDARKLADLLRTGMLRRVHHGSEGGRRLKQLVRAYDTLSTDTKRTMVRIKAIYRARGIRTPGRNVYQPKQREQWLELLTEPGMRERVGWLYEELDHLKPLRRQAKQAMLSEGRKHRAVQLLRTIPQLGPIRAAVIAATIDTPHRFRTCHQLWSYSGFGGGHVYECGIRDESRPCGSKPQAHCDSRAQSKLQSPHERGIHRRSDGWKPD